MPAAALAVAAPGTALAASPPQQQVYVLDQGSNGSTFTMNVLNAATPGTLVSQASLQVSNTDNGVTVSPDSSAVFTSGSPSTNGVMNTFNPLTAAATLIGTDVGTGDTALSPNGSTLYIAGLLGIDEYHPTTGTITKDAIHLGGLTSGLAVSPDGATLYAASNANDDVSVLNAATGAVSSTIPLASAPSAVLLSPDGSRLYVWGNQVGTVTVINTASDTVAATITIPGGKMNYNETGCITPDGSTLYVPTAPGPNGAVQVISTATDTITSTISLSSQLNPNGCAVSPDGSQLWVAYPNSAETGMIRVYSIAPGYPVLGTGPTTVGDPIEIAFGPDQAPDAALSATPGPQYQATQFDASASTVPYGSIASYSWNFGDGTTATTTTPTTSHVYTTQGPVTATVTETDGAGTSTAASTLTNGIEDFRNGGPQAAASQTFTVPGPGPGTVSGQVGYTGAPGCDGNPVSGTAPLAGATVSELAPDGTSLGSAVTGSDGSYSVAGRSEPALQIQVSGSNLGPSLPGQFSLASGGLAVSGSATQNLILPSPVFENVTVTDTTGHPVAGATVSEAAADPTAPFALFPGATAEPGTQSATPQVTGASGQATLCLYPSPAAHLTAAGPTGQGSAVADTSGGPVTIGVPTRPSLDVTSSLPTSTYAQPVMFTAAVGANGSGGPVPTGTVTFSIDGTPQPPSAVSPSGQATLTTGTLSGGVHTITAAYSGDSVYAAASGAVQQTVLPAATTATLASTEMPSVTGQAGNITATVKAGPGQGTPTGTVTFTVDGSQRPAEALAGGKASIKLASLPVGTHSIAVVYSGDGSRAASTSSPLTQAVNPAATSATVTTSGTPSVYGQHGKFTATVKVTAPGTGKPTGTVTFSVDGVPGQPVALAAGKAITPLNGLNAGTHQVTVTYSGDASYSGSTSAALTQVVNQAGATVTLTSSQNPVTQGGTGSITAKVADVLPAAGLPTGTVTFSVDGVARAPVALSAFGTARLGLAKLAAGSHTITAVYSGDANHAGAASGPLVQVVNPVAQVIRWPAWAWTEVSLRP
jgi:YVTN family beta-propeller protein